MTLTYQGTFRLGKLHDELVDAIPALAPTGTGIESQSVFTLAATSDGITLEVPDTIQEPQVAAELLELLQRLVEAGRSTPGTPQKNTGPVELPAAGQVAR